MAKDFKGLGDRNQNMQKGKSLLFSPSQNSEENTLSDKNKKTSEDEKVKFVNVPIPEAWHKKLKFELAQDTGKTIRELILDAIDQTYNFTK